MGAGRRGQRTMERSGDRDLVDHSEELGLQPKNDGSGKPWKGFKPGSFVI